MYSYPQCLCTHKHIVMYSQSCTVMHSHAQPCTVSTAQSPTVEQSCTVMYSHPQSNSLNYEQPPPRSPAPKPVAPNPNIVVPPRGVCLSSNSLSNLSHIRYLICMRIRCLLCPHTINNKSNNNTHNSPIHHRLAS